jgi:hypothetical protein
MVKAEKELLNKMIMLEDLMSEYGSKCTLDSAHDGVVVALDRFRGAGRQRKVSAKRLCRALGFLTI